MHLLSLAHRMSECGLLFGRPGLPDTAKHRGQYLYALMRLAISDCFCTCEQLGCVSKHLSVS